MEATYTPLMMAKEAYAMQNGGRKKRGRKPVFSANQFYPWKVEMMVKDLVSSMLKENGARLKKAALVGYEADGIDEVDAEDIFVPPDFEKSAEKIFREVENFSSRKLDDFAEKTVGRTFGYIPNQAKIREDFVNNFVNNCKSAAEEEKKEIANAVYRHRMFPDGNDSLPKEINEIQKKYTKNKSNFIARNETGNLNAAIQRSQIEGAGFEMYTWMSMTDGVTRDSHRNMNGIVCRWDDPTVYSADGGKTWRKRLASMFIGQPGQDYNCRCTAVPFDPQLEDDYSVKEEPEEKPEKKEPTPLEKAREEAKAAEERAEKAEKMLNDPSSIAKRADDMLTDSLEKAKKTAIAVLEERKNVNPFLDTTLLVPYDYAERGRFTLADSSTLALAKKNKKERDKFKYELSMAKKIEEQFLEATVFIGETGNGSNPDAIIGGILADFKHTEPGTGKNAISGEVRKGISQGAKTIIIDIQSDVGFTDAWNAINGRLKGKDDVNVYFKLKGNSLFYIFRRK